MSDSNIIASVRKVNKRFGKVLAVTNVSLEVEQGEFVTLLGPSGCGKTTLLRLLAGFEYPDSGAVWLEGENVTALPPYQRNVNQVFQSYALFPHLNVVDNIAFGLRRQKLPPAEIARRISDAISLVGLHGMEERMPDQLSGGQRQRVALARALAPQPAILLLDEPLSALDAKLRRTMQLELKRLQRHLGVTFIFVTHDQEEALTMSDRVAVMHLGRIEQIGTPREIYDRPQTPFVARFIGEMNLLSAEVVTRDEHRVRICIDNTHEVTLPAEQWPESLAKALVGIRPEKLRVVIDAAKGRENWLGTIETETFHGAINYIQFVTNNGTRLRIVRVEGDERFTQARLPPPLYCRLNPADLIILKESENSGNLRPIRAAWSRPDP